MTDGEGCTLPNGRVSAKTLGTEINLKSFTVTGRTRMEEIEQIISKARRDLAERLGLNESDVTETGVENVDFPDAALGAPVEDEMSAQVITPGWRIRFPAGGENYEYRATRRQLRLVNFKGRNYRI